MNRPLAFLLLGLIPLLVSGAVTKLSTGLRTAGRERPGKELKGFRKIFLNPGETKDFEIVLDQDAFSAYIVGETSGWQVVKGAAAVFVGTSSRDIAAKHEVVIP